MIQILILLIINIVSFLYIFDFCVFLEYLNQELEVE